MPDTRSRLAGRLGRISRRQVMAVAGGGALFGSAWATTFREAVLVDDVAHVTLARNGSSLGALISHRSHRIMVVLAFDSSGVDAVTELAAGFMRRRIDSVLVPASASDLISRQFRDHWRVRDVWLLPDQPVATANGLAGRSLRIDRLRIDADSLPWAAWQNDMPAETPWYLSVTAGRSSLTIASDRHALARMPLDPSLANVVACADMELDLAAAVSGIDVLAVPFEVVGITQIDSRIIELSPGTPVAIELRDEGIALPGVS